MLSATCASLQWQRRNSIGIPNFYSLYLQNQGHIDFLGHLSTSHDYVNMNTHVDSYILRPQAISVPCPTSKEKTMASLAGWVAIFDYPAAVTNDRGSRSGRAFLNLSRTVGCKYTGITACHLQADVLMGWPYRLIKSTLRVGKTFGGEISSIALLCLQRYFKQEMGTTPSEQLYSSSSQRVGGYIEAHTLQSG